MALTTSKQVLLQLISEATAKRIGLGKTHLIKLFYLSEVEHYRQAGDRLTDSKWVFHHYGPYIFNYDSILDEPEFEIVANVTVADRDFQLVRLRDRSLADTRHVDVKTSLLIKKIVGEWGSVPTSQLLDYVYFETEPMQSVKTRGEHLDFSKIVRGTLNQIVPLQASKKANSKIAALRARTAPYFAEFGRRRSDLKELSEDFKSALEAWNADENRGIPADITLRVQVKTPEMPRDDERH